MKIPLVFLSIGIALFAIFYVIGSPYIFSDGYGYYHVGKSLVTEGGFVSNNQPDYYPNTAHAAAELDGKYVTTYSFGNSILLWPFLTVSKIFDTGTIYTDYSEAFNGHSLSDGIAISIAAIFCFVLGIFFAYKSLRLLNFKKNTSVLAITFVWLSSYLLGYVLINGSFSHVYEVLATSLMLFTFLKGRKGNPKYFILTGIFGGLSVALRPLNLMILIPFGIYFIYKRQYKNLLFYILGGIPFALLLAIYNYSSYGEVFTTGYQKLWGISLSTKYFYPFQLLFSTVRGWFIYTPLALLGIGGLVIYSRNKLSNFILFLLPIILVVLTYSFWDSWWAGDSIGQRFFLALIPFVAIGLAYLFEKTKRYKKVLIGAMTICVIYSVSILVLYRFTPTAKVAADNFENKLIYPEVTDAERFTPFDIFGYHINLITESKGIGDYFSNLSKGLNGGRSLLMLNLGMTNPIARIENLNNNTFILHIIPNTSYENINADIALNINKDGEMVTYLLKDINTSKLQSILFDCTDECIVDYSNSEILENPISQFDWIKLGENFSVGFEGQDEINFVDYKLK